MYLLQEGSRYCSRSTVDCQLHTADFTVDLLHELNDEIHQLVLPHVLAVEICDQETDVVALHIDEIVDDTCVVRTDLTRQDMRAASTACAYLDGLTTENEELVCTLRQESRKAIDQHLLHLVCLLDGDTDAD